MKKINDDQMKFIIRHWDDYTPAEFAEGLNIGERTILKYAKIIRDKSDAKLCPVPPTKKEEL